MWLTFFFVQEMTSLDQNLRDTFGSVHIDASNIKQSQYRNISKPAWESSQKNMSSSWINNHIILIIQIPKVAHCWLGKGGVLG